MDRLETPMQVRNATSLLWASLLLTSVEALASASPPEDGFDWGLWFLYAIATGANGYIIYCASRRQNWARIVLFVITALVVVATASWPPDIGSDPWWSTLLLTVSAVADMVAVIWLFSGAGNAWFKGAKREGAF